MKTSFTPGPWKAHGCSVYQAENWKDGTDYGSLAICQPIEEMDNEPTLEESAANARLIAAAPAMFDALQQAKRYIGMMADIIDGNIQRDPKDIAWRDLETDLIEVLRNAAIAQAKGEKV